MKIGLKVNFVVFFRDGRIEYFNYLGFKFYYLLKDICDNIFKYFNFFKD